MFTTVKYIVLIHLFHMQIKNWLSLSLNKTCVNVVICLNCLYYFIYNDIAYYLSNTSFSVNLIWENTPQYLNNAHKALNNGLDTNGSSKLQSYMIIFVIKR